MSNRENEMKTCQARVWLGFPRQKGDKTRSGNSRYTLWRSEIAGFMQMHDIQNSTQAGTAKWQMVKDFAIGHRLTRGYEQAYNRVDEVGRSLQEALRVLLKDIRQKEALKRTKSAAEEAVMGVQADSSGKTSSSSRLPAPSPSPQSAEGRDILLGAPLPSLQPPPHISRGVIVSRIDPDGDHGDTECATTPILERPWEGRGVFTYLGMVYDNTLAHLISLALRKPAGGPQRQVRDLLGAITDPGFDEAGDITRPPKANLLTEDEDVEAWLSESKASPLRLLVLLERLPPDGARIAPQTPPPPGWKHVDNQVFETIDEPTLESSDDDGPIVRQKRRPQSKNAYERRITKLKVRQERLGAHIEDLEAQQKDRFPTPLFPPPPSSSEESEPENDGDDANEL